MLEPNFEKADGLGISNGVNTNLKFIFKFLTAFRVVACLFCKSATAYNPFIYFFMGKEFRNDCRNVVLSCFSNICPRSSNQVIGATDGIYVGDGDSSSRRMDKSSEFRKGQLSQGLLYCSGQLSLRKNYNHAQN